MVVSFWLYVPGHIKQRATRNGCDSSWFNQQLSLLCWVCRSSATAASRRTDIIAREKYKEKEKFLRNYPSNELRGFLSAGYGLFNQIVVLVSAHQLLSLTSRPDVIATRIWPEKPRPKYGQSFEQLCFCDQQKGRFANQSF